MSPPSEPEVRAAGAVLWRPSRNGSGLEVCVVHRPKYDDWSLPKGKLDAGEHVLAAAVREVMEETRHAITLGRPMSTQYYRVNGSQKEVRYWLARADDKAGPWSATKEIDRVDFLPAKRAMKRITHPRDADLVQEAVEMLSNPPRDTAPLVVLRHAKAQSRSRWSGTDAERPLEPKGTTQADRLTVLLGCFGVTRIVSSDALRCVDTVRPYATATRSVTELEPRVSEEEHQDRPKGVREVMRALLADDAPTVICSHRPVLPDLLQEAGKNAAPGVRVKTDGLSTGSFVVLHRRDGKVLAAEQHDL